eukprot:gnl/Dysnectes_brevis/4475_a6032_458.p1 GENE.gnl/Dysnectes_brevis/4475_a6032_458~~gnl/Dysnectes_brevis/4475_a6032_458.p1  ORF type:complete len:417 (+),score=63.45 gnl/Dysnectes_brevis/4475_a6032_458:172-1251(+)
MTENKGRGIRATRDLVKDEIIHELKGFRFIQSLESNVCHNCFQISDCQRCSSCHFAHYCSPECQKQHWKLHRLECRYFPHILSVSDIQKRPVRRLIFGTLRLLTLQALHAKGKLQRMPHYRDRLHTLDLFQLIYIDPDSLKHSDQHAIPILQKLIPTHPAMEDLKHMRRLSTGVMINSFMGDRFTTIEVITALVNHSCSPNATVGLSCRYGKDGADVLVSLKAIAAGEEITFSYIKEGRDAIHRLRTLWAEWRFRCQCEACLAYSRWADVPKPPYGSSLPPHERHEALLQLCARCGECGGPYAPHRASRGCVCLDCGHAGPVPKRLGRLLLNPAALETTLLTRVVLWAHPESGALRFLK